MPYFAIDITNKKNVERENIKIPIGRLLKIVKASSKESVEKFLNTLIEWLGLKDYEVEIYQVPEEEIKEVWGDLEIYEVD